MKYALRAAWSSCVHINIRAGEVRIGSFNTAQTLKCLCNSVAVYNSPEARHLQKNNNSRTCLDHCSQTAYTSWFKAPHMPQLTYQYLFQLKYSRGDCIESTTLIWFFKDLLLYYEMKAALPEWPRARGETGSRHSHLAPIFLQIRLNTQPPCCCGSTTLTLTAHPIIQPPRRCPSDPALIGCLSVWSMRSPRGWGGRATPPPPTTAADTSS